MKRFSKLNTVVFAVAVVAVLTIAACGAAAPATKAPVAAATEAPVATEAPATEAPVATEAPATEAPATEVVPEFTLFESPDGLISVDVPSAWQSQADDTTPDLISYVFFSEDQGAFVHYVAFDDGKTYWNQGDAGKLALDVLNNGYTKGAGDIKISKDEPMDDGSERLTWTSKDGDFSGTTVFKSKGTIVALISFIYTNPTKDTYADTLDQLLGTLTFNN